MDRGLLVGSVAMRLAGGLRGACAWGGGIGGRGGGSGGGRARRRRLGGGEGDSRAGRTGVSDA